jgi:methionine synthase II (cobalamin-independent)
VFATLAGGYPRPPAEPDDDEAVRSVLRVQAELELEPLGDGDVRSVGVAEAFVAGLRFGARSGEWPVWTRPILVDRWRFAADAAEAEGRAVKQSLPGPYSLGFAALVPGVEREALTRSFADALNAEARALAEAGCQLIQIDETAAARVGEDPHERALWVEAHQRLTTALHGVHLSLAILEGNADTTGTETIFAAPYASYLFDLITGPDNWRLAVRTPPGRGLIAGALDHRPGRRETKETLVWAARYAASGMGRGLERVGLASAGSLRDCSWDEARERIAVLAEGARVAAIADPDELLGALDPRAADIRSAALGRYTPRADRAPRRP